MSRRTQQSLKSSLLWRFLTLQAVMLAMVGLVIVAGLYWMGSLLTLESEDEVIRVLQKSIEREPGGAFMVRRTPELVKLQSHAPELWFFLRDKQGHLLSEGTVPPEFARIGDALDDISQARLGWQLGDPPKPNAVVRWVNTPVGRVQITAGRAGKGSLRTALLTTVIVLLTYISPLLVLMVITTLFVTPVVVRRTLASLGKAAAEAEQIDIDRRGTRLSVENIPAEISPLVNAVNGALSRLDEGYERQKRFMADAAHELRTPIAILNARLESLPTTPDNTRLHEDVARLSIMAEQLLDVQRLNQNPGQFSKVDLVAVGKRVAADIAPVAIEAGYHLAFQSDADHVFISGDQMSLERALTNLVQNAIEHGGRTGTITVSIKASGALEITDEGPGIPITHREQIFQPFYRLAPLGRGAGLGLNLVQEVVQLHKGRISVTTAAGGGACFTMSFPVLHSHEPGSD